MTRKTLSHTSRLGACLSIVSALAAGGCDSDGSAARQGLSADVDHEDDAAGITPPYDEDDDGGGGEEGGNEGGEDGGDDGEEPGCDTGHEDEEPDTCTAEPFDLARLAEYEPGQGDVIVDCHAAEGYGVSSWRGPEGAAEQLWVAGVYQTRDDHSGNNHPMGAASVTWSRPGSNVLVLSAYEPTTWSVQLAEGGSLERVIAIGYHQQIVEAPEGVEVELASYDEGSCLISCGYALPGEGGGCEGEDLVGLAEHLSGRTLTGFDGCYDATTFSY